MGGKRESGYREAANLPGNDTQNRGKTEKPRLLEACGRTGGVYPVIDVTELFRSREFRKIAHICKAVKYSQKFRRRKNAYNATGI